MDILFALYFLGFCGVFFIMLIGHEYSKDFTDDLFYIIAVAFTWPVSVSLKIIDLIRDRQK